jgi:hypothetical protein
MGKKTMIVFDGDYMIVRVLGRFETKAEARAALRQIRSQDSDDEPVALTPDVECDVDAFRARELFSYDSESGEIRRKDDGSLVSRGSSTERRVFWYDGKLWTDGRLAWLLFYGCVPADKRVMPRRNAVGPRTRIANLYLK